MVSIKSFYNDMHRVIFPKSKYFLDVDGAEWRFISNKKHILFFLELKYKQEEKNIHIYKESNSIGVFRDFAITHTEKPTSFITLNCYHRSIYYKIDKEKKGPDDWKNLYNPKQPYYRYKEFVEEAVWYMPKEGSDLLFKDININNYFDKKLETYEYVNFVNWYEELFTHIYC